MNVDNNQQRGGQGRPVRSGGRVGDFTDVFKRIKQGLGGRSQADVARALGIGRAAVSDAKSRGSVPADWFLKLARDPYHLNPSWLETGEGEMHLTMRRGPDVLPEGEQAYVAVPMAAPGADVEHGGLVVQEACTLNWLFLRDWLNRMGRYEAMRMVQVTGDSMSPTFVDGDMVLVDTSCTQVQDGRVHVIRMDTVIMVKRLVKLPGKLQVVSDNSDQYEPVVVDGGVDDIDILGLVLWVSRSMV